MYFSSAEVRWSDHHAENHQDSRPCAGGPGGREDGPAEAARRGLLPLVDRHRRAGHELRSADRALYDLHPSQSLSQNVRMGIRYRYQQGKVSVGTTIRCASSRRTSKKSSTPPAFSSSSTPSARSRADPARPHNRAKTSKRWQARHPETPRGAEGEAIQQKQKAARIREMKAYLAQPEVEGIKCSCGSSSRKSPSTKIAAS